MNRPLLPGLVLAGGLALAACSEPPQESSLQGPSTLANVVAEPCTPNVFPSLINNYFTSNKQAVSDEKQLMLDALNETPTPDSVEARVHGFNILRAIAARSKESPAPSASTGSTLAVEVLQCTFDLTDDDVIEQTPTVTASLFTAALNRTNGGTFEVRGGPEDPTGPVQAGQNNVVIAGEKPPTGVSWNDALNGQRLIYGDKATNSSTDYHFSAVPTGTVYDPELLVTTCVLSDDPSLMMTESNVGALAFSLDATQFGCGGPLAVAGRFDLLRHFAAFGRELLLPEPAAAAAVASTLVIGGAKGRSIFDIASVTNLIVSHTTVPSPIASKVVVNKVAIQSLTVTVTDKASGALVNGARVTLSLESNNGTFNGVRLFQNGACPSAGSAPSAVTGDGPFPNGTVVFTNVCIIKEGGAKVVMTATIPNRIGQGVGKTAKFTVSPK